MQTFKALLTDIDGTVYFKGKLIDGVRECLQDFKERGKDVSAWLAVGPDLGYFMGKVVPICKGKRFPCSEETREQVNKLCMNHAEKFTNHYFIRHGKDWVEWAMGNEDNR